MNRDTAITQMQLNAVNQVGPDGTIKYDQTGTSRFQDSTGKWVETPTYTQTTTLSPQQQAIKEQTDKASLNLGSIANEQSGKIRDLLNTPFEYNNQDAENWAYDLGAQRLDPRFAADQEKLRTQLISSGIRPGTEAYRQQMDSFGQTKNDAYNQLMLNGRQQAFTEALQQRNQPINEISALMSGSQVSMPQMNQTPQTGVGGVDYTGLVNQQYQAKLANSQAQMGGLFGLLGTGLTAGIKYSDRRLKTDIRRVGRLDNGLPVYAYKMRGSNVTEIGLMADEVEQMAPEAVFEQPNGFKMVDYRIATEAA